MANEPFTMPNRRVPAAGNGVSKKRKAPKATFIPKPAWMPPSEGEVLRGICERRVAPRQVVEAAIERLIGLLDHLDPDPDLEPSVGGGSFGAGLDLEGDDSDREPEPDEDSLGAVDGTGDQEHWAQGEAGDYEATLTIDDIETRVARATFDVVALHEVERQARALARRLRGRPAKPSRRPLNRTIEGPDGNLVVVRLCD